MEHLLGADPARSLPALAPLIYEVSSATQLLEDQMGKLVVELGLNPAISL